MARACSVCTHRAHASIDAALVQGVGSNRRVAAQWSISEQAVRRHAAGHLPAKMTQAQEAQELSEADQLLAHVQDLTRRTLGILTNAETSGDWRTALLAIREARGCVELLARLQGQLAEQAAIAAVNVNVGNPYADLSDTDLDKRIDLMLELFARAKARQEAGEIPPGSADAVEWQMSAHDPRAALTHKLDTLAERRSQSEPDYTESHTLKRPAAGVADATECDTLKKTPAVVAQPVAPRRNGGWRAV